MYYELKAIDLYNKVNKYGKKGLGLYMGLYVYRREVREDINNVGIQKVALLLDNMNTSQLSTINQMLKGIIAEEQCEGSGLEKMVKDLKAEPSEQTQRIVDSLNNTDWN
jgi:hypothetical protein